MPLLRTPQSKWVANSFWVIDTKRDFSLLPKCQFFNNTWFLFLWGEGGSSKEALDRALVNVYTLLIVTIPLIQFSRNVASKTSFSTVYTEKQSKTAWTQIDAKINCHWHTGTLTL